MPIVNFAASIPYRALANRGLQPLLQVTLFRRAERATTAGILDSGAEATIFGSDVAESLGIEDVTEGEATRAVTLAGSFDYYIFELEMEVVLDRLSRRFPARVGFLPARTTRNLLGRDFIFSHFVVGFADRRQEILLQPED